MATAVALLLAIAVRGSAQSPCPDLDVPPVSEWPAKLEDGEHVGIRELRIEIDVDGDGSDDVIRVEDSSGSLMGLTSAEVTLTSTSETIAIDYEYSFGSILDPTPIPQALRRAGSCALEAVEQVLFRHPVVDRADPSLAWLLDSPKRLRWIDGPPTMPGMYTLRDEREWTWLSYAGHVHAYRPLVPFAEEGGRELLGTAHGVILNDTGRARHAWLYVFSGGHKLRWPSVAAARIEEGQAVVTLAARATGPTTPIEVRIDLGTGRVAGRSGEADSVSGRPGRQ